MAHGQSRAIERVKRHHMPRAHCPSPPAPDSLNLESLVGVENTAHCFSMCVFFTLGVQVNEGRSQRFTDLFVTGDADDRRAVRWIRAETFPQQAWHRQGWLELIAFANINYISHTSMPEMQMLLRCLASRFLVKGSIPVFAGKL